MKIFCIGLSKTATTSITAALDILGFDAIHWHDTKDIFKYTKSGIEINHTMLSNYAAFADTPIARIYKELDSKYPGSKFILTVRDVEKWVKSFEDQFGKGRLDTFSEKLHMDLYGTSEFDYKKCTAAFNRHTEEVTDYFKDRATDLLIIDVTAGDGWEQLCGFLDLPIPAVAFPKKFTKGERKYTLGYRLNRLASNPNEIPGKIMLRIKTLFRV